MEREIDVRDYYPLIEKIVVNDEMIGIIKEKYPELIRDASILALTWYTFFLEEVLFFMVRFPDKDGEYRYSKREILILDDKQEKIIKELFESGKIIDEIIISNMLNSFSIHNALVTKKNDLFGDYILKEMKNG